MKKMSKVFYTSFATLSLVASLVTASGSNLDIQGNIEASEKLAEAKATLQRQRGVDIYAGAWIDDNNNPHIAFTELPNQDIMLVLEENEIFIEQLQNTYSELVDFQNRLADYQEEYGISETFVDESKNTLNIKYTNKNELDALIDFVESINNYDVNVNFIHTDEPLVNTALQGGDKISYGGGACSIGFRAKKGTTYGYVTAGHCFPVGAKTDGGTVVSRVWSSSSNMDAEFINPNVGSLVPNTDIQGTTYRVNDLSVSQGSYVKAASWVSTRTGYVTSMSATASFTSDGTYTNLIQCSGGSVGGMSGGINISGGYAIGITKGGSSSNRYVVKASRILSSLGLTAF